MKKVKEVIAAAESLNPTKRLDVIAKLFDGLDQAAQDQLLAELKFKQAANQPENPDYSVSQAAKRLNSTPTSVKRWFDQGKLRGYRTESGREARISIDSLRKFATSNNIKVKFPKGISNKAVFTTGQAAKLLDVSRHTVTRWIAQRKLPAYFVAGKQVRRIPRENLLKFADEFGKQINKAA